jgi:cell division septation protein DedD
LRKHSPLPEGYRVEQATSFRLFNAKGKLVEEVPGSPDAAAHVEARAWKDAWQQLDTDLREDLRALREGIRPLEDLRRLRQYMRMLDAVERAPIVAQEQADRARVVRKRAIGGFALAAAAAALAVFVSTSPLGPVESDQTSSPPGTSVASSVRENRPLGSRPAAVRPVPQRPEARTSSEVRPTVPVGRRTVAQSSRRFRPNRGAAALARPLNGYAVSFGEFTTRATAEGQKRLIRAKGYLVYVAQVGDSYLVVTRPYRTRAQADRLANALQEIGLPAITQIAGTFML